MTENLSFPLGLDSIKGLIPHREPFLLIDEVLEAKPGLNAKATKYLAPGDWYFTGHFPSHPVMPGVLIIESLAQTVAVCAILSLPEEFKNKPVYFVAIEEAKFRRPVLPDSHLINEVRFQKKTRGIWFFECFAKVNGLLVSDAVIRATIQ